MTKEEMELLLNPKEMAKHLIEIQPQDPKKIAEGFKAAEKLMAGYKWHCLRFIQDGKKRR